MFCMALSDRLFGLVFCLAAYFEVPFTDLRVTRTRRSFSGSSDVFGTAPKGLSTLPHYLEPM